MSIQRELTSSTSFTGVCLNQRFEPVLLDILLYFLTAIVVLAPNGQLFGYDTIAVSERYSGYLFVALGIQNAERMRHILLSSVACPAGPVFQHYHKRHDFQKNVSAHKTSVLIVSETFVKNISHCEKN